MIHSKFDMLSKRTFISIVFVLFLLLQACSQKTHEAERPLKAPRGFRSEGFMKAAYTIGLLKLIETEPVVPENIEVHKDVV